MDSDDEGLEELDPDKIGYLSCVTMFIRMLLSLVRLSLVSNWKWPPCGTSSILAHSFVWLLRLDVKRIQYMFSLSTNLLHLQKIIKSWNQDLFKMCLLNVILYLNNT